MRMLPVLTASLALLGGACKNAPPANPEFSDALLYAFVAFEEDEADLAFAIRQLERQAYLSVDVEASSPANRGLQPNRLSEEDVADIEHPDRDVTAALPIAVAAVSPFDLELHPQIQMLTDHTPVEPYSPDFYERTFLDGEDCWEDRSCERMETFNDLVKKNFLMEVPYAFNKTFRWVDLALPDPADVPDGAEAVNAGLPRWAYVARSWTTRVYSGTSGNSHIQQSYTVEMWVPRDGAGFVRDGTEFNADGGEWTADSAGGGVLRLLSLWSETQFDGLSVSDDMVIRTTRAGIDDNFKAADDWLEEQVAAE